MKISPRYRGVLPQISELLENVNPVFAAGACRSLVHFAECYFYKYYNLFKVETSSLHLH